jgi:hypothetical protein
MKVRKLLRFPTKKAQNINLNTRKYWKLKRFRGYKITDYSKLRNYKKKKIQNFEFLKYKYLENSKTLITTWSENLKFSKLKIIKNWIFT